MKTTTLTLLTLLLHSACQAQLPELPPTTNTTQSILPNDPLFWPDATRRLPWAQGTGYGADSYQWYLCPSNTPIRMFTGTNLTGTETGTNSLNIAALWSRGTTSSIPVAVLNSSGFDIYHEDLTNNIILATNIDGGTIPVYRHGTEVTSVIGAEGNNGKGMCGVCWKVPLIIVKFSSRTLSGLPTSFSQAVVFAVTNGARILVIPEGLAADSGGYNKAALEWAGTMDVLVVCAAKNSAVNHDIINDYPTSWRLPNVLTVTDSVMNGTLLSGGAAWGSNTVFCSAPGRRIPVCTTNNQYGFDTGSSFSCGVAAGVAALVWNTWPSEHVEDVIARLKATVTPAVHQTITGGVVSGRALQTTRLHLTVAGDARTVEESSDGGNSWHLFFVTTNATGIYRAY